MFVLHSLGVQTSYSFILYFLGLQSYLLFEGGTGVGTWRVQYLLRRYDWRCRDSIRYVLVEAMLTNRAPMGLSLNSNRRHASSFLSVSLWDSCVVARRCRERERERGVSKLVPTYKLRSKDFNGQGDGIPKPTWTHQRTISDPRCVLLRFVRLVQSHKGFPVWDWRRTAPERHPWHHPWPFLGSPMAAPWSGSVLFPCSARKLSDSDVALTHAHADTVVHRHAGKQRAPGRYLNSVGARFFKVTV